MLTRAVMFKVLVNIRRALDVLDLSGPTSPAPEPPEEPPEPKRKVGPAPGSQAWYKQLPPPARNPDDVSMNSIARSIPRRAPPRAPGQQARRFNGMWWHY